MSDNNSKEDTNNTHQHQHDPNNLQNQNLQTSELNHIANNYHEFNQPHIHSSSFQYQTSAQPAVAPSTQLHLGGGGTQTQVLTNSSNPQIQSGAAGQFINPASTLTQPPLTQPNYLTNPTQAGSNSSNFLQNAPKFSEFLIVSAPVPAIIDEQRDLVEITRVENPAYKANKGAFGQSQLQYQQQLQQQAYMNYQTPTNYPNHPTTQMMPGYDQNYYQNYNGIPYAENTTGPTQPQTQQALGQQNHPNSNNYPYFDNNQQLPVVTPSSSGNNTAPSQNTPESGGNNSGQFYNF